MIVTATVLITLPDVEVVVRQMSYDVKVPHGYCPFLARRRMEKQIEMDIKTKTKTELIFL